MNALLVAVFATLGAVVSAGDLGHGAGVVVSGPSGVVTQHGAIGPAGHGLGYGGAIVAGPALGLGYGGAGLGHGGLGLGYGAAGLGHGGLGLGYGGAGLGYGGAGLGYGAGSIGLSGHGVAVRGPATVPAVIAGPSGKIVADGLYGVPSYGGHGW